MPRLEHAITVLDVLGSVVQAVPVVGDGLKSATEVTKKICEMVKVRSLIVYLAMSFTSMPENEREPRSIRGACGSRGPATRSRRKHDIQVQPGEAEGHGREPGGATPVRSRLYPSTVSPDIVEQHAPKYQTCH
jgi:hypothetical protein